MTKKDYVYIGIIILLFIPLLSLLVERQVQISVSYNVFETIIKKR